ncbi:MAG: hypothetical protein SFU85_02580 [Candidatus Methylacidiphilales bacterium]|nr:hypothetical protein [Candidatus Methylacidiphilales bacterium]
MNSHVRLLGLWFMAVAPLRAAGELNYSNDIIRQRVNDVPAVQARSLLNADVVDLEFKVDDFSSRESSFSGKNFKRPSVNQKYRTLLRSRFGDGLVWESGLDLAVSRTSLWDNTGRENVNAFWKPEYLNRFIIRPNEKSEWVVSQSTSLEQRSDTQGTTEFWRAHMAFRQQITRMTEMRLEAWHDNTEPAGPRRAISTDAASFSVSQQLGTPNLKLRLGGKILQQDHQERSWDDREILRREAGLDWRLTPLFSLYGGTAWEEEDRPQWIRQEERLLYELRGKWTPDPIFQLTGGLSLDSQQQAGGDSGHSRVFLRGDLKHDADLSTFLHARWEQWERTDPDGTEVSGQEKVFVGAGQDVQIDPSTRFTAEYAMADESQYGRSGRDESLVEHMISFLVTTQF